MEAVPARLSGQVGVQLERARDVCMAVCYHLRYSNTSCSMPVREMQEFEGPEESQANAMVDDGDPGAGGAQSPHKSPG